MFWLWIRTALSVLTWLEPHGFAPEAFEALADSSPTIPLAVAASGRTCSSGPHLSCLPWVTALSQLSFTGPARPNEPPLILCSVKGCLSLSALKRYLRLFVLAFTFVWWCLMLLIILLCFLEARISNISLNFPFHPETGNTQNLPDCPPSWGREPQWGNVWKVTGVSWRWAKVDVNCGPHMILNCLCSDSFKFVISLLNKSSCVCLDVGYNFLFLVRLRRRHFNWPKEACDDKRTSANKTGLPSRHLHAHLTPLNMSVTCSQPLINKLDTRVILARLS